MVHGVPEILHTDQGRQFEADVIQSLCQRLGIRKQAPLPLIPNLMAWWSVTTGLSNGGEWDTYVKQVTYAYNSSKHARTRFTPFYLMHGREARVPAAC